VGDSIFGPAFVKILLGAIDEGLLSAYIRHELIGKALSEI
jgi:hypothetical protein